MIGLFQLVELAAVSILTAISCYILFARIGPKDELEDESYDPYADMKPHGL